MRRAAKLRSMPGTICSATDLVREAGRTKTTRSVGYRRSGIVDLEYLVVDSVRAIGEYPDTALMPRYDAQFLGWMSSGRRLPNFWLDTRKGFRQGASVGYA